MNRVVNNAAWIIGCKIIKALLTLLVTALTARYLTPTGYGLLNYAASVVAFVLPLMKLGFDATLTYEFVRAPEEDGRTLGTALLLNLASGLLCMGGVAAFVYVANPGETETLIVCTLYSILLLFQATEMVQYWFQARLLSRYTAPAMLFSYLCVTAFQVFLLMTGKSVYWFALSNALDFGIISLILLFVYRRLGGGRLSFSRETARRLLSVSRHYILSSMMITIFAQTDKIMLKMMVDEAAVGYYSAAATCATMTSFVFAAIIDSVRPVIFENKAISQEKMEDSLTDLYTVIIYFSLFVSAFMTLLAPLIIRILYGADYAASVAPLQLIVWFTTFSYLGSVRDIWILSEEKQRYVWIIYAVSAGLNVALNAVLIPVWGVMGAAFASLCTQIFANAILGFLMPPIRRNNILMLRALDIRRLGRMLSSLRRR